MQVHTFKQSDMFRCALLIQLIQINFASRRPAYSRASRPSNLLPRDLARPKLLRPAHLPLPVRAPVVVHLRAAHPRTRVPEAPMHVLRRRARERVACRSRCHPRIAVDDRARVGRGREGLRFAVDAAGR